MQRVVAGLAVAPDFVLVNSNRCLLLPMPSQAVVKGDSRVLEISTASIKVTPPQSGDGCAAPRNFLNMVSPSIEGIQPLSFWKSWRCMGRPCIIDEAFLVLEPA